MSLSLPVSHSEGPGPTHPRAAPQSLIQDSVDVNGFQSAKIKGAPSSNDSRVVNPMGIDPSPVDLDSMSV